MSSYYQDQDVPRRHRSHRPRTYEEEEIIESRNTRAPPRNVGNMELVRRRDSSTSSIEEIRRDFAPGEYVKRKTVVRNKYPAQRARSADRGRYDDDYYGDPRRSDGALGGGRRSRRYDDRYEEKRSSRRSRYDSDSESESPPRHRRKSLGEQALAAIGLGSAAGAASGSHRGDRDRARSRSRHGGRHGGRHGDSRSRSRSRSVDQKEKIQQAVKAALTAGAIEAFRSRKEPGGWQGQGKRAITAAIGAAGINGAVDRDPAKHSTRHTVEAVLGGLAGNRLINGPRENSRSRSRTRGSRDEGGGFGGAGALAAGGLAALAAKTLNDRSKSKDRESRGRRYSSDDESPPPRRSRSKSVSAYVSRGLDKGMAVIGLGNNDKHRDDYRDERSGRRQYDDDGYAPRPRGGGGPSRSSSSSSFDSEEEEKKRKKMVGKEYLTAGLATVATIHAAHSVYQSKEKRDKRHKEVLEGKMTEAEASRLKSKARLQDVASIGIAALGIKGAVSEWKEVKESREECHKFQEELQERREKHHQHRQSRSSRRSVPDLNRRYQGDYYQRGPVYQDANPYGASALPPPPIGAPPIRY